MLSADFLSYCVMVHVLWPTRSDLYFKLSVESPRLPLEELEFSGLLEEISTGSSSMATSVLSLVENTRGVSRNHGEVGGGSGNSNMKGAIKEATGNIRTAESANSVLSVVKTLHVDKDTIETRGGRGSSTGVINEIGGDFSLGEGDSSVSNEVVSNTIGIRKAIEKV